jgi:hypothetical protein
MTRSLRALTVGVALGLFGQVALAANIEQRGQPEQSITVMNNYGVDVQTAKALRSIVPSGWKTFVHPSAILPQTLSWRVGQEWTDVLQGLASSNQNSVLVDWTAKTVLIRSTEASIEDGATRAEISQAATTPLPKFVDAVPQTVALQQQVKALEAKLTTAQEAKTEAVAQGMQEKLAREQEVASLKAELAKSKDAVATPAEIVSPVLPVSSAPASPVAAPLPAEPTVAPIMLVSVPVPVSEPASDSTDVAVAVVAPVAAALATPIAGPVAVPATSALATEQATALATLTPPALATPGDTEDFTYREPVALNKPLARNVAQGIANKFHLRLVWAAPDLRLRGPVTLLGNSASEDTRLLKKALGLYTPIDFDIPAGEGVLVVQGTNGEYPDLAKKPTSDPIVIAAARPAPAPAASIASAAPAVKSAAISVLPAVKPIQSLAVEIAARPVTTVQLVKAVSKPEAVSIAEHGAQQPALDSVAPAVTYVLNLHEGEALELALQAFAKSNGYTLEWQVVGGFEPKKDLTYQAASGRDVLVALLPQMGLSADIYKTEKHIIVRPVDPAQDR